MKNILIKSLNILLIGFPLLLFMSSNTAARDYLVSGAGGAAVNGLYVRDGTHDTDKDDWGDPADNKGPQPLFRNGAYRLGYRSCTLKWVIVTGLDDSIVSCGQGTGYIYGSTSEGVFSSGYWYPPEGLWGGCVSNPSISPLPFPTVSRVYNLTVTTVGFGNVTLDDEGISGFPAYYTPGTVVELTPAPDAGWEFTGWSGDLSGTGNPQTITMNSAKNVTATFQGLGDYDILLNIVGSGTVALDPPGGTYDAGTTVTLTASPDPGWALSSWSGDLSGKANPEMLVMNSDKNVTATFSDDSDGDGVSDGDEDAGLNGGDANGDLIPDKEQAYVVSTTTYDDQYDVWLEVDGGTLTGFQTQWPYTGDWPTWVEFPYGFFEFTIEGVGAGGAATVNLHLPPGGVQDTYYKYGPTPDDPNDHWYSFMFESATQTGAEINGDVITLHFVDGQRGDDDLLPNGTIYDPGGPGVMSSAASSGGPSGGGGGSGDGSSGIVGGCFVAGTAFKFYEAWLPCVVVILVLTIIAMLLAFRGRTSKRS